MGGRYAFLPAVLVFCLFVQADGAHFEVQSPYPGEIFDTQDVLIQFQLLGKELVPDGSEGQVVIIINHGEAMRTSSAMTNLRVPGA